MLIIFLFFIFPGSEEQIQQAQGIIREKIGDPVSRHVHFL